MTVNITYHKRRRLNLVRFSRATTGNPVIDKPDPDTRGFATPEFGAVLPVTENKVVTVRLNRDNLDPGADLFVKSSDETIFTIDGLTAGKLPSGASQDIQVNAKAGGTPKKAVLEVHFGSLTGPILAKLAVWVFIKRSLRITPHNVSIKSATAAAIPSAVDINTVIDLVRAVWAQCGLELTVGAAATQPHTFATAGRVVWGTEANAVLSAGFVPNTINAYFCNCLVDPGRPGVLGWGLSRQFATANSLPSPGIFLGDSNVNGSNRATDAMFIANDLAHEIGHFLQLPHTENLEPPNNRTDLWSRRRLMHNFNTQGTSGDWHDQVGYGAEAGGSVRRGCFVTMKDLSQLNSDGEITIVRNTIESAAGPY